MTLEQYIAKRRYWEFALFALVIFVFFFANLGVEVIDGGRQGADFDYRGPLILEATSHIALVLAFPLLLLFEHRYPFRARNWGTSLASYVAFSVVFSLLHVTLMYWGRVLIFSLGEAPRTYHWDNWFGDFSYEYLKDFRTYIFILATVYLYRFILLRLQGEAGFLSEEKDEAEDNGTFDRFLVKKLGREFLVRVDEIDWIESCGNYVNLHVGNRVYPLRETMTRIDERLLPMGFQRVHRSAIVNLDRVAEIVAFDTGDGQAKLQTDATVPVSRRFRQELRERLSQAL
jgi:hypothetical protein